MVESGVQLLYAGEQKLEISLSFKGLQAWKPVNNCVVQVIHAS